MTGPMTAAVMHHAEFGTPSALPSDRVTPGDWEFEPIERPETMTCHLTFSRDRLDTVLRGSRPKDMDDKWFIYADGPDDAGNVVVHLIRSWTGYASFEVYISTARDEETTAKPCVTKIDWETSPRMNVPKDEVVETVKRVFQYILRVQLQ